MNGRRAAGSSSFRVHRLQMTWGTASAKSLPPGGPCRLLSMVLFLTSHLFGGLESALVISVTDSPLSFSLTLASLSFHLFVYLFNFCLFPLE